MIKVNLLPREIQERGKGTDLIILCGVLAFLIVIASGGFYFIKLQNYNAQVAKKKAWQKELAIIKEKVKKVEQLDAQKAALSKKKATAITLLKKRLVYPKLMDDLFSSLPNDIWVKRIQFTEPSPTTIKIEASSSSLSIDAIANWIRALESNTSLFSGIDISAIDIKPGTTPAQSGTYDFSMTFIYTPPLPKV